MNNSSVNVPREESLQGQLFHYSPQQVCDELGLNWIAAVRLFESGWLSFDPAQVLEMDEKQETEFRFLGALAAAGCDSRMLAVLLKPLKKPYLYSLSQIYYDLGQRTWNPIPMPAIGREDIIEEWIAELVNDQDVDGLKDIRSTIDEALDGMGEAEQDDEDESIPAFSRRDTSIVQAAILLLRKTVKYGPSTPAEGLSIGKAIYALQRLPKLAVDIDLTINISGPTRIFGEHQISHWWQVEVLSGEINISSGGYFFRASTGGDSFTIMQWDYSGGSDPELNDYLFQNQIVDDAKSFEPEVEELDLSGPGYEVTVTDDDNPCLDEDEDDDDEADEDEMLPGQREKE